MMHFSELELGFFFCGFAQMTGMDVEVFYIYIVFGILPRFAFIYSLHIFILPPVTLKKIIRKTTKHKIVLHNRVWGH